MFKRLSAKELLDIERDRRIEAELRVGELEEILGVILGVDLEEPRDGNGLVDNSQTVRRFFEIVAQEAELDESTAMEIADLYEEWAINKLYPVGKILKFGVNEDNETQLYKVQLQHTSQDDWRPDQEPTLYKPIGFEDGIPIWTEPSGGHDAYGVGDKVRHNGKTWVSLIPGNIWEPGVPVPGVETWVLDS